MFPMRFMNRPELKTELRFMPLIISELCTFLELFYPGKIPNIPNAKRLV